MRGALRNFIEVTTPYRVCDAVDGGVLAIKKATESPCDLVLLHLRAPISDSLKTASLLRTNAPRVKIVGFTSLPVDLIKGEGPETGLDAVLVMQDGLSNLIETLKALMPVSP